MFLELAISSLHLKPSKSIKKKATKSKGKQCKSEEEDSSNSDLEAIEALLAKRYPKGKGKYKDKIPLICWSHCWKVSKQRRKR